MHEHMTRQVLSRKWKENGGHAEIFVICATQETYLETAVCSLRLVLRSAFLLQNFLFLLFVMQVLNIVPIVSLASLFYNLLNVYLLLFL